MAEIVAAYAVPHTPSFVADVAEQGPDSPTARLFATIKAHLDRANPDVIVMIQNDHFNTFFFDNWPTFALGMADKTSGPSDQTPMMPRYDLPVAQSLAQHMLTCAVEGDFDVASSQEFDVDHAVLVPLHFLRPEMDTPIVPIFINCLVPPLPSARRCHALGRLLRSAIELWPVTSRLAVIASGSLSLEIGGPLIESGKTFGVPDRAWAAWILECVKAARTDDLVKSATPARIAKAGNVAGEVLNWIALLGITGTRIPDMVMGQPDLGNAFAAWTLADGGSA